MSAWHDRVGDLTLFKALTGGAFDRQNCNIAGNLTKIFQKSQMPRGLPGGMGGFGIDRYIRAALHEPGLNTNPGQPESREVGREVLSGKWG